MEQTGIILRIERSSIHDGAGLRTVVFLKGCPLSCVWCSTPEGQASAPEQGNSYSYGRLMSVNQVLAEVKKDELFYFHSGGGVTFSGGEPLMQADFLHEVLAKMAPIGIDSAIESSLFAPYEQIEKLLPFIGTWFVDIKFFDAVRHQKYCGLDNTLILENLSSLAGAGGDSSIVLRITVVPGVNDDEKNLTNIAHMAANLGCIEYIELLPYHRLGVGTYAKLGLNYCLSEIKPPTLEYMEQRRAWILPYINCV